MKALHNNQLDASVIEWPVYMRRAIDLAKNVMTATPNPRVGCVIVQGDDIVGEGWHVAAGQAHAEVMALEQAGERARGATAFVSLEPCAHTGRTGPCNQALIAAGINRVVIADIDPNPEVAGKGVAGLEAAAIEVCQLLDFESDARAVNPGFFKRHQSGLPFVRLKLAMSLDGRTALANGESKWITSESARADVQRLRAGSSVLLTGINTVLADDPALNVRAAELPLSEEELEYNKLLLQRQPIRGIIDSQLRTPGTAQIINSPGDVKIYTSNDVSGHNSLADNVEIKTSGTAGQGVDLQSVLESLASDFDCNEVLVEAGPTLSGAFIESGLVDELILYIAPKLLGSDARPLLDISGLESLSECVEFTVSDLTQVGNDIRVILTNKNGTSD